eukprot:scaffold8913_cov72-Skeletonema_dohrnii-CCMP3373.AAC.1
MKVYSAALLTVLGISATTAFLAPRSSGSSVSSTTCKSSLDEEFATAFTPQKDDFYADYDPSKYESQNNDNRSYGGGYDDSRPARGRGGGR